MPLSSNVDIVAKPRDWTDLEGKMSDRLIETNEYAAFYYRTRGALDLYFSTRMKDGACRLLFEKVPWAVACLC